MSATSDGPNLEREGLTCKVVNETFQFLEEGNQNGYQSDFDKQNNETANLEGEDLTVSQLYCLTNKENKLEPPSDKKSECSTSPGPVPNQGINNNIEDDINELRQEELMTISQLHEMIEANTSSKASGGDAHEESMANELTVSQLYSLKGSSNQSSHSENNTCDRIADSGQDEDTLRDQNICSNTADINKITSSDGQIGKSEKEIKTAGQCEKKYTCSSAGFNDIDKESQSLRDGAVSTDLKQHNSSCTHISEGQTVVSNTEAGTSVREIALEKSPNEGYRGLGLDQSSISKSYLDIGPKSEINPGSSVIGNNTSDVNCDNSGKTRTIGVNNECDETLIAASDKVLKGNNSDGRIDHNDKLLNNYSEMDVLKKRGSLASGGAPGVQGENVEALRNESDSNQDQLSLQRESDLVSNTCLNKEVGSAVYKLDREISSVLEKCEHLLQRPSHQPGVNDSENHTRKSDISACDSLKCNEASSVQYSEKYSDRAKVKDNNGQPALTSINDQSSQVLPKIMGGTNSTEKLEKIRERSKLHDGDENIYIGPNCAGVDLEKTLDEYQTSASIKKDCHTIKGTILPNMENSLFSEMDTSGSIQGNYEQSHQITANVSHEFNHLGKQKGGASAISVTTESQHQSFLTCSENTEKSPDCNNLHAQESSKTDHSRGNNQESQGQSLTSLQGQGHKEGHNATSKEGTDVVIRKDILRSPKLHSPKMSPMLKDRRFRHGRAGSMGSGSGSDQESVDSQRGSEDSDEDDEDAGIYGESHRHSKWLYCGDNEDLTVFSIDIDIDGKAPESALDQSGEEQADQSDVSCQIKADQSQDSGLELGEDLSFKAMPSVDRSADSETSEFERTSTWGQALAKRKDANRRHNRTESISTTASELEFRNRYQARTRKLIQRQCSQQTYQRMSERFYENERTVVLEKANNESTFGFHIKGTSPVVISTVEPGSIAEKCHLKVGDVLLAVNDVSVMDATHQEVIKLMSQDLDRAQLVVAPDKIHSDDPICYGYLVKQGGSGFLKNWRRRWFILKDDHCLYYYKTDKDADPLGAILLTNYTITKAPEINRKHTFKAVKYGHRTYMFQAENEADMNRWANAMSAAATANTKTDTWLDISSHNVGLSALSIKQPDCHGYLTKMGNRRKNWKRRYCVLKDACLYYYLDVNSTTAQGVAHLHGYVVDDSLPTNRKYGITLHPPEDGMRMFSFSAENETDKKRWIKAFCSSIGRWVRADDL